MSTKDVGVETLISLTTKSWHKRHGFTVTNWFYQALYTSKGIHINRTKSAPIFQVNVTKWFNPNNNNNHNNSNDHKYKKEKKMIRVPYYGMTMDFSSSTTLTQTHTYIRGILYCVIIFKFFVLFLWWNGFK